ncbi:MAG: hypothetical protein VKK04_16715 [Synechococcales bacterium]|nr:hypothetical protein [Synechococcales bacterium]
MKALSAFFLAVWAAFVFYVSPVFAEGIVLPITLEPGDKIALQGDNGRFLSRIRRGSIDGIEAAKDSADVFSQFTVGLVDGKLTLQGDNGRFLSRIRRGAIDGIEAAKDSADVFSQFTVGTVGDKLTLKGDNGKFLSRIRRGSIDGIEAAKDSADVFSQFRVYSAK